MYKRLFLVNTDFLASSLLTRLWYLLGHDSKTCFETRGRTYVEKLRTLRRKIKIKKIHTQFADKPVQWSGF